MALLTLGGITRRAISLFRNSNAFLQQIDRQYDSSFGINGAKIGSTLRIRLPNDYTVRSGATAVAQSTNENQVTVTVATQKGVDVSFTSADLSLSLDDFSDRILSPMVNVLAGAVATDVMSLAEGVPNVVHNVDATNTTLSPTMDTWLAAGALLDLESAPRGRRCAILDPLTQARTVSSLAGLFNSPTDIGKQYRTGMMGTNALGIDDWYMDQTTIKHLEGTFSAATFTSVAANGTTVTTSALTGTLNAGDIITFAATNAVNRVTKASTGVLQQFVVTANAANAATTIQVYPPIVGTAIAGQTVTPAPVGGAAIVRVMKASEVYRKNLVFVPEAFTLVTADLPLPGGAVIESAREMYDGISLRMIRDYNSTTDVQLTRLDILYGFVSPRPEFACIVADAI